MCIVEGQEARAPHFHPCHSYSSTLHPSKVFYHSATLEWTRRRFGSYYSNSFGIHHDDEGCGRRQSIASILLNSNPIPQVVALGFFLSPWYNYSEHVHIVYCTFATASTSISIHDAFAIQDSTVWGSTPKLARMAWGWWRWLICKSLKICSLKFICLSSIFLEVSTFIYFLVHGKNYLHFFGLQILLFYTNRKVFSRLKKKGGNFFFSVLVLSDKRLCAHNHSLIERNQKVSITQSGCRLGGPGWTKRVEEAKPGWSTFEGGTAGWPQLLG